MFAFALTFLAVTLILPQTLRGEALPHLSAYLGSLEPALVGYILSFFIIASWWNTHHRLFSAFVRYDAMLVRLNSFFLLLISVTPFLVSLLFAYGVSGFGPGSLSSREAVALYGAAMAFGGCVLLGIWRHGTQGRRLVRPSLSDAWIRTTENGQLLTTATFAASVGVAFVSPLGAELIWIIVIFAAGRHLRHHAEHGVAPPARQRTLSER